MGDRHWLSIKKKVRTLNNGVVIALEPFERHKGRHWTAWADSDRKLLVGEWKTWQMSQYIPLPKVEGQSTYGRGGGTYRTWMERESWVDGLETAKAPNTERLFSEWKRLISALESRAGTGSESLSRSGPPAA